jgi:amino acid transporter
MLMAIVFTYFVNMVSIFGLLSWISILLSHIYFVKARKVQGITETSMAYVAPQGIAGSMTAMVFCCIIAITKNFTAFLLKKEDGSFDTVKFTEEFVTG